MRRSFLKKLLVVLTFVVCTGGIASAQQFQTPSEASQTIESTLLTLSTPAKSPGSTDGSYSSVVNNDAVLLVYKIFYLKEVSEELKQGADTAAAIENVYVAINSQSNGRPTTYLNASRQYAIDLLSK